MVKRILSFWIISAPNKKSSIIVSKIEKILEKKKFVKTETNPSFLFIVGGDGTFVNNVRGFYSQDTKIIGINSGTLGFYSNFSFDNIKNFEKKILEKKNYIQPWIVEARVKNTKFCAINEIVVSSLSTMTTTIHINNHFYQKYKGSGISISTKTGTTGYCKNLGGAIIMPDVEAYELIEIAPTVHAKNVSLRSPIILGHSTCVKLEQTMSNQPTWLIADGMQQTEIKKTDVIELCLTKAKCWLFFPGTGNEYIKKLRKAFIKGK